MGLFGSKAADDEAEDKDAKMIYDTSLICWDEHGNLRYGEAHPVSPDKQIREVMQLDALDDEEEVQTWYIVEAAWITSWLAYVRVDKGPLHQGPAPGPCRNDRLICWDEDACKYTGRFGLLMAVKQRGGDYRRVNKATWEKFKELYPGSGPTISMQFLVKDLNETGVYDTSNWTIHDPPPPPEDPAKKKKKKTKTANPIVGDTTKGFEETKSSLGAAPVAGAVDVDPAFAADSDDDSYEEKREDIIIPKNTTKNEPKAVSSTLSYQKVQTSQGQGRDSGSADNDALLAGQSKPQSEQAKEKYFEDMYFGKD